MLKPGLTGWRCQYDRMMRTYERVRQPVQSSVDHYDDLHHFFQDCWHLKDWIKNDPALAPRIHDAIEGKVKGGPLDVVADLANAAKHLVRTKNDRTGAYGTSTDVNVYFDGRPTEVVYRITLRDGSQITALQLATEAVAAWEVILVQIGLA
jgi:hypothetical protein